MSLWENNAVLETLGKSSKLPKEQEIKNYFDQFIISDQYNASMFPGWDPVIKSEMNKNHNPNHIDYDEDEALKSIDISDGWVANTFYDENLVPTMVDSSVDAANMNWSNLACNYPANFKALYEHSHRDARNSRDGSITKGAQLSRYWMRRNMDSYKTFQLRMLVDGLKEKGFTKVRSEPELQKEILTRKKQFPGQQLFCMLGREMTAYFQNIHKKYMWNGALLVRSGSYSCTGDIDEYESAVFARCQVRTSHRFLFHYGVARVPRRWQFIFHSVMEYALEIDQRIEEEEAQITLTSPSLARFGHID